MKKANFKPQTDIEAYLNNDFNIGIFNDLREDDYWKGAFEPLDFLNLLYEQFEIVFANKEKPISIVKHLFGLKLKQTELYYLLYNLTTYMHKVYATDEQLMICKRFIQKEFLKLENELFPITEEEEQPEEENKYDFNRVKQHIETLKNVKDKIKYLIEIKTDFRQNANDWDVWAYKDGKTFDAKCAMEIKKLNELSKLETDTSALKVKSIFKLSDKKGAKTNLIRVLNALYELRLISKKDGQVPTKQEFVKAMGEYLGVDLSKYHSNLSQALQNQPLEVNLKVFDEMIEVTKKAHYQTKD